MGVWTEVKTPIPVECSLALNVLNETLLYLGYRYEVGLPCKRSPSLLPSNRQAALKLFYFLDRRLLKDKANVESYSKIMNEYVALGFASKMAAEEVNEINNAYYIPHHSVFSSQKLRVVFNASSLVQGVSLNQFLYKGPDLLNSLIGVLMRFRLHRIPVSSDIEKMFYQVRMLEKDRPYLSFVWREPGSPELPGTYRMNVHIFGAVSSPSVCQFVLLRTAEDNQKDFPEVTDLVQSSFYVDNFLKSFEGEREAITNCQQLSEMLKRGGFRLTKWLSSSRTLMSEIDCKERLDPTLDLEFDPLPTEKTLGIFWDSDADDFLFRIKTLHQAKTKREIFSSVSSIYEPLGFLSPVVLLAKTLLQAIWKADFDWDEPLPQELLRSWKDWSDALISLRKVRIPRCMKGKIFSPKFKRLHVCRDASEVGFGAVVY